MESRMGRSDRLNVADWKVFGVPAWVPTYLVQWYLRRTGGPFSRLSPFPSHLGRLDIDG